MLHADHKDKMLYIFSAVGRGTQAIRSEHGLSLSRTEAEELNILVLLPGFRRVRKLAKKRLLAFSCLSVCACLSVRPQGTRLPLDGSFMTFDV